MTSPHVTELPRRLEPVSRDTFLGGIEPRPRAELAQVVALRPRDPMARRRRPTRGLGASTRPVAPSPLAAA
jgi:hypothetical protein